jgi:DNA-binding NarL/FixJ family response regulator
MIRDRLRVLVVDDHVGIVKSLARLLSIEFDVVGTLNDALALPEAVLQLEPDVIVIDMHLPEVDGLTACRQIMQQHPALKVVVFTAVDDTDLREQAFAAGAYTFVSKLGSTADLLSVLRQIVAENSPTI